MLNGRVHDAQSNNLDSNSGLFVRFLTDQLTWTEAASGGGAVFTTTTTKKHLKGFIKKFGLCL